MPSKASHSSATQTSDFEEHHVENLAEFTDTLGQHRFWNILPEGQYDTQSASGLFDRETGLIYPSAAALRAFLDRHPFSFVLSLKDSKPLATLHSATRLLWNNETSQFSYSLPDGKQLVEQGRWAGLEGWRLPNKEMLWVFANENVNPHRIGQEFRLAGAWPWAELDSIMLGSLFGIAIATVLKVFKETSEVKTSGYNAWLTAGGCCNVDRGNWAVQQGTGSVFACNPLWEHTSDSTMLADFASRGWQLVTPSGDGFYPDMRWQGFSNEALLSTLVNESVCLRSSNEAGEAGCITLDPHGSWLLHQLLAMDYSPCRLPKLDRAQLTDPEKGLWELWGQPPSITEIQKIVARDPGRDVQDRAVAIDFGTSSTVVAMDTASGARELLRIGVRDFYQPVQAQQFENPTVLECLDFTAFQDAWTTHAYRPRLDWNWMRSAHEAQASFRDNPGDTRVLASILPRLKQWALRSERVRLRITDRQGREIELEPHTERNPVRGQPLEVASNAPFDPIELYAWYLGMAINWRGRGLFLNYYLSFPVKYPREIKDRILASFRRGLQRSLPQTLIDHHPDVLNKFEVTELASEPAAYAAAALPQLGVEPSDAGTPYAVFDFGGGTTDFDFGLLRWATPEEEDEGYERVFEHLASAGDNFLGGENLLEHLVYASFQHNLTVLRKERIQFTQPLDAPPFAGSEAFLAPTQAAQTNTVMLAARLRPFLEGDEPKLEEQIKLDLIDADGSKKPCELALDAQALDALLARSMRGGVEAFLAELARLRPKLPAAAPIHLLLAGNGSRSRHIKTLFDTEGALWSELLAQAFGETPPEIIVHPPLPIDEINPHAPTAKTGVALGLLRLAPGENALLLSHVQNRHEGQAPFAWFAGRLRRGQFEPVLSQGVTYGQWHDLGALQQGVFNLFVTTSPRAHRGLSEGDPVLKKHRLSFPAAPAGARLFARATKPHSLELAAAMDHEAMDECPRTALELE